MEAGQERVGARHSQPLTHHGKVALGWGRHAKRGEPRVEVGGIGGGEGRVARLVGGGGGGGGGRGGGGSLCTSPVHP